MFARKVTCFNRTSVFRAVGEIGMDGCVRLLREQSVLKGWEMALDLSLGFTQGKVIKNEWYYCCGFSLT